MRIDIEWLDGHGISDRLLAQTYCRLQWSIDGRIVTRAASGSSRSLVEGVHVSIFPLFEWLVENWWFLIAEPSLVDEGRRTGRDLARNLHIRDWLRRHSLLAAQEGWIYPDLRFCWDDGQIAARWSSDPEVIGSEGSRRLQYVSDGWALLDYQDTVTELQRLCETVCDRLYRSGTAEDLPILDEWKAILESTGRVETVNRSLAALGIDPYDPAEEVDQWAQEVESILDRLQPRVAQDFFAASDRRSFEQDQKLMDALMERAETVPNGSSTPARVSSDDLQERSPFERGYRRARRYREQLGIETTVEPTHFETIEDPAGRAVELRAESVSVVGRTLRAAAERPNGRYARIIGSTHQRATTDRFVKACAIYHLLSTVQEGEMRLVTSAKTSDQAAARAFAAELLAPSANLRRELSANPDPPEIDALAQKYQVSSQVLEYQVQNHSLAELAVA